MRIPPPAGGDRAGWKDAMAEQHDPREPRAPQPAEGDAELQDAQLDEVAGGTVRTDPATGKMIVSQIP
jgi:hypothetical protein